MAKSEDELRHLFANTQKVLGLDNDDLHLYVSSIFEAVEAHGDIGPSKKNIKNPGGIPFENSQLIQGLIIRVEEEKKS